MDEAGNGGTAGGQPNEANRREWKPRTSAQKNRKGQTRSMSDKVRRINERLKKYPKDPLAWAVGFLNTGRSTQIHAMAHGWAGALSDRTLQQLRTLLAGLLSIFEPTREHTATQLSLALNGGSNMGIDINEMLVHLVSKGLLAPVLVPSFRDAITEWMASRPSKPMASLNPAPTHQDDSIRGGEGVKPGPWLTEIMGEIMGEGQHMGGEEEEEEESDEESEGHGVIASDGRAGVTAHTAPTRPRMSQTE